MDKNYKVKVNDSLEFEFSEEEIKALDTQKTSDKQYHLLKDNRSYTAEVLKPDFLNRTYEIKINSNIYSVKINNDLDQLIDEMGLSLGSSQQVNDIKAPMPGLILEVNVKEGDEVKEGDYLLVLEAMKMENTLTAPRDGVVKSVTVAKSDTVEKNQLLIEME
ncbi:acetyl-CoA carboxylase biotin carboxyl carrier protein subunit [Christiangramia forsetii]|uniref:Biotin carboxyl carrier protein of acyl-CoA carboxylase n=2 Tax=Christiangramia forsetii TaxID=411153 RepID=A0M003_CHRFK|nr:acetyl-CoA carboxylase biotin carboxyl carrier protein subunit [Christiangramia forsetii]GGG45741.1 acetyl-CoA carboxylase biotin carboxyl carrier protein subunit [Christiangramia forsetii]CAL65948.1 biotin carboxyl carrier protein of acyl-CoA carboxylase [Christiangramia forsetii KT0803]